MVFPVRYTPPRSATVTGSFNDPAFFNSRTASRALSSVANGFAFVPGLVSQPLGAIKNAADDTGAATQLAVTTISAATQIEDR